MIMFSRSVRSNSSWPHGLQMTRLLYPQGSLGEQAGEDCHALPQRMAHVCHLPFWSSGVGGSCAWCAGGPWGPWKCWLASLLCWSQGWLKPRFLHVFPQNIKVIYTQHKPLSLSARLFYKKKKSDKLGFLLFKSPSREDYLQ